jgi:hypothetical protein
MPLRADDISAGRLPQLINGICFSTNCTSRGSKFSSELQLEV